MCLCPDFPDHGRIAPSDQVAGYRNCASQLEKQADPEIRLD